jgi:hypothetical protein
MIVPMNDARRAQRSKLLVTPGDDRAQPFSRVTFTVHVLRQGPTEFGHPVNRWIETTPNPQNPSRQRNGRWLSLLRPTTQSPAAASALGSQVFSAAFEAAERDRQS